MQWGNTFPKLSMLWMMDFMECVTLSHRVHFIQILFAWKPRDNRTAPCILTLQTQICEVQ